MMEKDTSTTSLQQEFQENYQRNASDAVALFHSLADKTPGMIWMAGPDKKCNFFNKRWLEFTGHTLQEEIGNGWQKQIHPEDLTTVLQIYNGSFDKREEFSIKYQIRRKDGAYKWILNNASPYFLPNGDFAGYIGSCVDVTETVSEISKLENQNYLIKTITDNATVGLLFMDEHFMCTFMNTAAENIVGYKLHEVKGKNLHDLIHHTKRDGTPYPRHECPMEQGFMNMHIISDLEQDYIRKNGEFITVVCSASPIISGGKLLGAVLEIRDITEQRQAEQAVKRYEERFRALIEKSSDVISLIDQQGNTMYVSPSVKRVLGYDVGMYEKQNGFEYVHPADMPFVAQEFQALLNEPGKSVIAEVRVRHAEGDWRWIETVSTNLLNDPNIQAIVVNFRDVTERKVAEEKAKYTFYHDSLTDLPNRNYFTEQLATLLTDRPEKIFGVLIIDLDRFKMINESLGHAIGDRMIQEVSLRLAGSVEETDTLARLGGDEYGIILPDVSREEEIGQVCYRILEALKPAFSFENQELYITPSIGISVHPYDGQDVSSLLKNADSALYRAKELGRNNFQYYSPSMNATTFQQLAMENTLRKALENNEFLVYYQPQIDITTGKIIQVEALIRWMHPELGLTFPDEFITIAETTGLIQPIGEWVLRQACMDVKYWEDSYGIKLNLAVNMSARQLRQKHLVRVVRKIISETNFNPEQLELELTESVLMEQSHAIYNTMVQLKKDGIKLAIDDFNTGYSSLNYIKRFPIDILKIDRSFVKGIPMKEKDTAIANAVINLAHSLGMIVVAEGVERPDQLKFLQERNCDKAQGYMFSPPIPQAELLEMLKRDHVWRT